MQLRIQVSRMLIKEGRTMQAPSKAFWTIKVWVAQLWPELSTFELLTLRLGFIFQGVRGKTGYLYSQHSKWIKTNKPWRSHIEKSQQWEFTHKGSRGELGTPSWPGRCRPSLPALQKCVVTAAKTPGPEFPEGSHIQVFCSSPPQRLQQPLGNSIEWSCQVSVPLTYTTYFKVPKKSEQTLLSCFCPDKKFI